MSNLRWIVRDGKNILQQTIIEPYGYSWEDVPTYTPEPPKKSLAQVLFEAANWSSTWESIMPENKCYFIKQAKAAMDYLEAEGWRKP